MRLLRVLRAVLWSFFGVGRGTRDLEGVHPAVLIAVAFVLAALLVGGIATLVHFVGAPPGRRAATGIEAARVVPPKMHGAVVVADSMEERMRPCVACHGSATEATKDGFSPRIAGKPAGYLFNQLVSFRDGRRRYQPMVYLLQNLSDDYLREMASYFSQLNLPYPPPESAAVSPAQAERARQLVEHGDPTRDVPACVACHGPALTGLAPNIPGLLGLPRQYMNSQFGSWRNGTLRSIEPDCMGEVARRLAPEDAAVLASWLAAQPVAQGTKPRAGPAKLPLECGIAQAAPARSAVAPEQNSRGRYLVAAGDCV